MPVSDEVASQVADQLGDWDPKKPKFGTKPNPLPDHVPSKVPLAAQEIASAAKVGLAQGGDFVRGAAVGTLMPFIPEGNTPGAKAVFDIVRPREPELPEEVRQQEEHPKTVLGKVVGPMAKGVGGMAYMPILPEAGAVETVGQIIGRNVVAAAGMGELSEVGKKVFGGLFSYFDPSYRHAGEMFGEVMGGGVGAQANVTRVKAMGEVAGGTARSAQTIVPAFKSAWKQNQEMMKAGEKSNLWGIFSNEFGNLRTTTNGLIQEYTNRTMADAIRRDIFASSEAEKFVKDSEVSAIDQRPWGLPERVMVPALTTAAAERTGRTMRESGEIKGASVARQGSIVAAYNKLEESSKLPATPGGIEGSALVFQKITQAKVDALTKEEGQVQATFGKLDPSQQFERGEAARVVRDQLAEQAFKKAEQQYAASFAIADAEGVAIPSKGVREEGAAILERFYGKVDPGSIPPEVKSVLSATRGVKGAEGELPGHIGGFVEAKKAEETAAKGKDLTLKEANDVVVALGKVETEARQAQQFEAAENARALKGRMLASIEEAKMSPTAKEAYVKARENYRTDYAERFQEGMGKQMGKEQGRTSATAGREALKGEKVLATALTGETEMREWDRVYGSNPDARKLMVGELENRFRRTLETGRNPATLERQLDAFKGKYEFALNRFPEVADRMEQAGAKQMKIQMERAAELARYESVMGGPITMAIGPIQAKEMYKNALADPAKMRNLIAMFPEKGGGAAKRMLKEVFLQANPMKTGEYDAEALYKLITAGKKDSISPSSLQILAEAALGKEGGAHHMAVLEALGNFTKREAATNPKNLRPMSLIGEDPVKQATGQTLASWASNFNAMRQGRVGSPFLATLGITRLVNVKAQQAVEAAKIKALYDPETAQAVLELAATPAGESIGMTTAKLIWGNIKVPGGGTLVDRLVDKGYVKKYINRGFTYGIEQASSDKDKRSTARE